MMIYGLSQLLKVMGGHPSGKLHFLIITLHNGQDEKLIIRLLEKKSTVGPAIVYPDKEAFDVDIERLTNPKPKGG